jgi:hypothetical protein
MGRMRTAGKALWGVVGGTAAVAGAVALLAVAQRARFERRLAEEARALWAGAPPARRRSLDGLPRPVRRYAEASGAAQRAPVRSARLRHGGAFRPALDRPWVAVQGLEYLGATPPGFVWWGRIRAAPGVWVEARDRSAYGEGRMLVRLASLYTLADARGPELDQGALLRLLGELVWLPTALLDQRHVSWTAVDETSARATLAVGGRAATALFRFGPDDLPSSLAADRHRDVGGRFVLTPWGAEYSDHREVDGLRVPFRTEASWVVDGAVQPYARWELESIEHDVAEPY